MRLFLLAAMAFVSACSPQQDSGAADRSEPSAGTAVASQAVPPASPAPNAIEAPAKTSSPALVVDGEGLRLLDGAGGARAFAFGQPKALVVTALERLRGAAGKGMNEECGAGPIEFADWPDGLGLLFQDGRFAGWTLDGREGGALTTASGIGPGSTRAELEKAHSATVSESTLGTEFAAGDLFGILDGPGPGARITHMWAGTSCNMR